MMGALRWCLFKKISRIGWAICPEPYKTRLYQSMNFDTATWEDTMLRAKQKEGMEDG